jgi:hypothetical protein
LNKEFLVQNHDFIPRRRGLASCELIAGDSHIRIDLRHEMMGRSRPCFDTFYRLLLLLLLRVMLQEYGAECFRPVSFKRVCCTCSHASQRAGQLC